MPDDDVASAAWELSPRAHFDLLLAGLDDVGAQGFADLAFAQLTLAALPAGDPGRDVLAAGSARIFVLRIALSCARSRGFIPDSSRAAGENARRLLAEGRCIMWPPPA